MVVVQRGGPRSPPELAYQDRRGLAGLGSYEIDDASMTPNLKRAGGGNAGGGILGFPTRRRG